ncbi:sulfotransferase family 2 domain-containing protein [Leisingera sp. McT4-56]|uniref:sulfotransferase family 2 domain-containing protein n=1 Tax=Leisingera sp. McT4-56 TaxID=2881255 RepID=UPI001CF88B83|nr:sulfotransferase family 2 domain-containing protein [Leisingera sp. McT4-56]MCB4455347.1 sulfotransferase family protein [Leisingera sp. McT4-56]
MLSRLFSRKPEESESEVSEPTDLKRIVFFHVPKCGGSSVRDALKSAYREKNLTARNVVFHLDSHTSKSSSDLMGENLAVHREHVFLYKFMLRKYFLLTGHFPYSDSVAKAKAKNDLFVTLLRDPFDRKLSQYYYNRHKADHQAHFGTDLSLEDWLQKSIESTKPGSYTRYFCGNVRLEQGADETDGQFVQGRVDAAIKNLRTFDVVGNVSDMAGFAGEVSRKSGLSVSIDHLRRSPKSGYPKFRQQPKHIQALLEASCEHDVRIYESVFGAGSAGA